VGSHIFNSFLNHGYKVKCVVRSESSVGCIKSPYPSKTNNLDAVKVPDFVQEHTFDEGVKGVTCMTLLRLYPFVPVIG